MNKNLQEPKEQVSARRRLVRGVFAAPAALSLYSGSALAAASISCVAKEVSARQEPVSIAGTDTYVRVRLYNMTNINNSSKVIGWIKGADLTALNAPATYLTSSQWQVFSVVNATNPPFTVGQIIGFQPTATNWTFNPTANGMYVAVRMDTDGNIKGVVGLGSGEVNGYAVHKSCWASVHPTA